MREQKEKKRRTLCTEHWTWGQVDVKLIPTYTNNLEDETIWIPNVFQQNQGLEVRSFEWIVRWPFGQPVIQGERGILNCTSMRKEKNTEKRGGDHSKGVSQECFHSAYTLVSGSGVNGDSPKWQISSNFHLGHSEFWGSPWFQLDHFESFWRQDMQALYPEDGFSLFLGHWKVPISIFTKFRWPVKPGMGGASKGQTELPLPWSWWWELPGAHDTTRTRNFASRSTANLSWSMDFDRETNFFIVLMYLLLTKWLYHFFGVLTQPTSLPSFVTSSMNLWRYETSVNTLEIRGFCDAVDPFKQCCLQHPKQTEMVTRNLGGLTTAYNLAVPLSQKSMSHNKALVTSGTFGRDL